MSLGYSFVAVSGRPVLQLARCPAAELQQFLPVLLKEVEHPGNGAILLLDGSHRRRRGSLDMEPAGPDLMAPVPHGDRLPQDPLQGMFFWWNSRGHGMGHDPQIRHSKSRRTYSRPVPDPRWPSPESPGHSRCTLRSINLQLHPQNNGGLCRKKIGSGL